MGLQLHPPEHTPGRRCRRGRRLHRGGLYPSRQALSRLVHRDGAHPPRRWLRECLLHCALSNSTARSTAKGWRVAAYAQRVCVYTGWPPLDLVLFLVQGWSSFSHACLGHELRQFAIGVLVAAPYRILPRETEDIVACARYSTTPPPPIFKARVLCS